MGWGYWVGLFVWVFLEASNGAEYGQDWHRLETDCVVLPQQVHGYLDLG